MKARCSMDETEIACALQKNFTRDAINSRQYAGFKRRETAA